MENRLIRILCLLLLAPLLISCAGISTFHDYARAGDTISIAAGWQQNFKKDNVSVTITPAVGSPIDIPQGDPSIRAVVNLYPDPLSSMIISRETGLGQSPFAGIYAAMLDDLTGLDKDWYETTVFLDLPAILPTGAAVITISDSYRNTTSSSVEIIDGVGSPASFQAQVLEGPLSSPMMTSLGRSNHYTISFDSTTIPYAIEVTLTHDPDIDNGGSGKAFPVNPVGYKKNLAWSDNGTTLKTILTPASNVAVDHMKDFKFYVAGQVTNLSVSNISAFDSNGNTVPGVTASIVENN